MTTKNEPACTTKIANDIEIPIFPEPNETMIIPLDSDFHRVVDEDTDIVYVMMPYWYWNLIIRWKVETTRIVRILTNND